jgi:hypothetical protein
LKTFDLDLDKDIRMFETTNSSDGCESFDKFFDDL